MTYQQKTNTRNWIRDGIVVLAIFWIKSDISTIRTNTEKVPVIEAQQANAVNERNDMRASIGVITTDVKTLNGSVIDLKSKIDNVYSLFDEWGFKNAMK